MIHLAYPNVSPGAFVGCGRYLSLPTGQAPDGYSVAQPDIGNWGAVRETALTLAPELKRLGDHCQVYERRDRPEAYRGDSQDLAYLLALIRCVRPLLLESLDGIGDVWCTGVVHRSGWHATLAGVDNSGFETKLRTFLAQPDDRLFLVPLFNVLPEHVQLCHEHHIQILTLRGLRAVLTSSRATGQWSEKRIVTIDAHELGRLVTALFRTPLRRVVLNRWKEAVVLGALLLLSVVGGLAWPVLFRSPPPVHTQQQLAVLSDELQDVLQSLASQIEWTRLNRPDVPNIPRYPGELQAAFEDRARNEFARWIEYLITGYQQSPLPNATYAAQRAQLPAFNEADRRAIENAYKATAEAERRVFLYRDTLYRLLQELPQDNERRKRQADGLREDMIHALAVSWFEILGNWLLVQRDDTRVQVVQAVVLPTILPNGNPVPSLAPGQAGWRWTRQQLARLAQEKTPHSPDQLPIS